MGIAVVTGGNRPFHQVAIRMTRLLLIALAAMILVFGVFFGGSLPHTTQMIVWQVVALLLLLWFAIKGAING